MYWLRNGFGTDFEGRGRMSYGIAARALVEFQYPGP